MTNNSNSNKSNSTLHAASPLPAEEKTALKDSVLKDSMQSGAWGGMIGGALGGLGTLVAHNRINYFKKLRSASIRTAFVAMGALGGFALVTEVQLLKNMRKDRIESAPVVESEESFSGSILNAMKAHPYRTLAATGVPAVLLIGRHMVKSDLIKQSGGRLSVALMHTRVVGQFTVLGLLLTGMFFSGNGPLDWEAKHKRN